MPRRNRYRIPSKSQVKPTGLVGWWRFDELGGVALDYGGNANNGSVVNASRVAGYVGGALTFVSGDYVSVPHDASINVGLASSAFSVVAWIKPSTGATRTIISKGRDGANNTPFLFQVNNSGKIFFQRESSNAGIDDKTGTTVLQSGVWCHVGFVFGGDGTLQLYVNGSADATFTGLSTSDTDTTENLEIGRYNRAGYENHFVGKIDDVRLFTIALTSSDVKTIYDDTK